MEHIYFKSDKTDYLDEVLKKGKENKNSPVACLNGLTGSGKTSATLAWLEHNKLKSLYIPVNSLRVFKTTIKYSPIDELAKSNKPDIRIVSDKELVDIFEEKENDVNVIFTSEQIDSMNQDTILVLDNYDIGIKEAREELLKLIKDLYVIDPRVPGKDKLKKVNPLMIIIINELSNVIMNKTLSDEELDLFNLSEYK